MSSTGNAVHDDDMALDLAGLLRTLGGAMRWLLPLVLVVAAGTFVLLHFVPAKYLGEARILIESTNSGYPGAVRGIEEERALLDNEGVASQVQLLMSADLARRVAKRLDLVSVPEFEADSGAGIVNDALVMLGIARDPARVSPEERVLKIFNENLEVYRLEGSRVIAVDFSSQDPELAAAVANTILDEYMALQSRAKRKTTEFATSSLEPQIANLKTEVQAARKAVEDFRAHADLLMGTDNLTLSQQELAEISSSYSQAQSSKAESQAKADLVRELLESGGSLETASDVLNSLLIQRLRERQVAIQSNIAELSITLLPNHPQLKALQSQLNDYNRQLKSEARKVLVGLENDAKVSAQQAAALKARLGELKTAAARSNSDQVRLAELEREANAKATQLDELISSFRDADSRLRAQAQPADARIISRAAVPIDSYAPKVLAITIIAALTTFILGCAFVIMREFLNGNVLYPVAYDASSIQHPEKPSAAYPEPNAARSQQASWGADISPSIAPTSTSYSFGGYKEAAERYVSEVAAPSKETLVKKDDAQDEPVSSDVVEKDEHSPSLKSRVARKLKFTGRSSADDREALPDHVEVPDSRMRELDKAMQAGPASGNAVELDDLGEMDGLGDLDGLIVVLSVDDPKVSHEQAFKMARAAAAEGAAALMLEVFPTLEAPESAAGFSDLVEGDAIFSKIIYRDAASPAHIIEAGTCAIDDEMAESERFQMAVDAISKTYETIVVDLGTIDGSIASANFLRMADRVLLMSIKTGHGYELESAARLLAYSSGAEVEVLPAEKRKSQSKKGSGRAA
ncbi:GumC family protein [Roseibium algae]|uniref:GumC family protein n=1 Tax=Roseibium algae TaxID=3123038 RepID=A0ABU8TPQ3_9HYPH